MAAAGSGAALLCGEAASGPWLVCAEELRSGLLHVLPATPSLPLVLPASPWLPALASDDSTLPHRARSCSPLHSPWAASHCTLTAPRPRIRLQIRANLLVEDPSITRASDAFPARRDIGLPGVPYDMGAMDVRYAWRLWGLEAETSAQFAYVGHSYLTFDGGTGNAMGGYGSGRVAQAISGRTWRATVYVDNIADERGNTFAFGNPFSRTRATQATPLRPRTLGFGLTRSF